MARHAICDNMSGDDHGRAPGTAGRRKAPPFKRLRRKARPFDMKRSQTNLEHVHTGSVISEEPDNAGGPLDGCTYTWKPVHAGGLSVCIWEARQSGRPGDKYNVRYMEADHEDEKNAYKNTCLTLFDRYPWRLFFWGSTPLH